MYSVKLTGFKTRAQAEEFVQWYSGQGEQDAIPWFEESQHRGDIDVSFMGVDGSKVQTWRDDTLEVSLNVS